MNEGRCLCGAVRYEVDGPFAFMSHCHCSMCRKHHGAMFATFVAAPLGGLRWTAGEDQIGSFTSSRSFCRVCGSVTPMVATELGLVFAPAGNLTGELGLRPQYHLFVGSKAPWYPITDDLPQHDKFPPPFEAPDVVRPEVRAKPGVAQGSCLCGDVGYEYTGTPEIMRNCHCSRCRLSRSAAHATNVFVKAERFEWVKGSSRLTSFDLPGAKFFGTTFCSRCGSLAPRESRARGVFVIPAGSLDSDPGARPSAHIFAGSKVDWFDITDDLPQYAELPPQA